MTKEKFYNYRNTFLTFLLIANSGFPFFTNDPWILVYSLFFTALFVRRYYPRSHKFFFIVLISLAILVLGQTVIFRVFSLKTTISLYARWIYPFIFLYVVRDKFFENYVKVLYWLTIISLLIHLTRVFIPPFQNILNYLSTFFEQTARGDFYSYNPNIIIFTTSSSLIEEGISILRRNPGPFWEPGAFGVYLVLGFMINTFLHKSLWLKKNLIFLLAITTTWSTGTFVSIMFFVGLYGILVEKKRIYSLLIIPLFILSFVHLYDNFTFLSDRIDRTIYYFEKRDQVSNMRRDRMISAIVDIQDLMDSPIFGYGRNMEARFSDSSFGVMQHRNNGTTDFLIKYGIIFSIFYFYYIRKSFDNFYKNKTQNMILKNIVIITVLLLGFYEVVFQMPVFIALFYLPVFRLSEKGIYDNYYTVSQ